jgi:hypothetical protein
MCGARTQNQQNQWNTRIRPRSANLNSLLDFIGRLIFPEVIASQSGDLAPLKVTSNVKCWSPLCHGVSSYWKDSLRVSHSNVKRTDYWIYLFDWNLPPRYFTVGTVEMNGRIDTTPHLSHRGINSVKGLNSNFLCSIMYIGFSVWYHSKLR